VTLSRVLRAEGILDEFYVAAKVGHRRFGQERKRYCAATRRKQSRSERVADDGRCLLQSALPICFANVAKHQSVGMESGGLQHGAREGQEGWVGGGDADEFARGCGEPFGERSWNRTNLQGEKVGPFGKGTPDGGQAIGKDNGDGAIKILPGVVDAATVDRKAHGLLDLEGEDAAQVLVGFDEQEMVGRLHVEPLTKAGAHNRERRAKFTGGTKKSGDQTVESEGRRRRQVRLALAHVDTAAVTEFNPAFALELAVSGADGVGMQAKTACEVACAGESVSGGKVVAQNSEDDLGDELFADGDFAAAGKPELHAAIS
jgi:hypothetical protein